MGKAENMVWEFNRKGEWSRVVSPIVLWDGCDDLHDLMMENGYVYAMEKLYPDGLLAPRIYRRLDNDATYQYVLFAWGLNTEGPDEFVCRELPDLIEFLLKMRPLWDMRAPAAPKVQRGDDSATLHIADDWRRRPVDR